MSLGDVIDGLDVDITLTDDDLPAAAIVLLKVVEPDGRVRLAIGYSTGLSWLERVGMVAQTNAIELAPEDTYGES